ncbi:hypothetical protein ONZ43_g75 [Nemania bipapillata]|uniref:Uncharacterized protein n=1 Tax=Nemania bipapillata TaxID=110536 RepID=A0ACC2J9G8_9PEZI|nr:hypothetical protein ONZ43_g75 [Nemania bipapillata]
MIKEGEERLQSFQNGIDESIQINEDEGSSDTDDDLSGESIDRTVIREAFIDPVEIAADSESSYKVADERKLTGETILEPDTAVPTQEIKDHTNESRKLKGIDDNNAKSEKFDIEEEKGGNEQKGREPKSNSKLGKAERRRIRRILIKRYKEEIESIKHAIKRFEEQLEGSEKNEDQKSEVAYLERQKEREEAVEKVRRELNRNNREPRRRMFGQMDKYYYRRALSDSEQDEMEEGKEKTHLQDLRNVIDEVQSLEERIRDIRTTSEKVDSVVDRRIVLQKELDLENMWLDWIKKPTASVSTEASADLDYRGHFSSSLPVGAKPWGPLGDRQVRLLVLWAAESEYYPLLCSLKTHTLDQGSPSPPYAALSYSWGPDRCNGRLYLVQDAPTGSKERATWGAAARYALRIPIRNNLFRALLRLRRKDHPVSLWVDGMCINQTDEVEKTTQLRQMINIYQNAKNVCVWLGESDDEGRSDDAMDFIPAIMDFAVLDRYAQDTRQAHRWYSLAELMRDRWFSRRWVVQEISLAREATVHCGEKIVQWADFADAVSLLVSNQDKIQELFEYSRWRDGPNTLGNVQSFGAHILLEATNQLFLRTPQGQITRPIKKLEALVTSLKTFDTSDQKDLIYSLVSIASDTPQGQYSGKQATVDLEVNYNKQPDVVYKDFTKFCIISSKSLDILCRPWAMPIKPPTKARGGRLELPSWIPLLSKSEFGDPEEVYSGRKNGESLVGPFSVDRTRYNASAGADYNIELVEREFEGVQYLKASTKYEAHNGETASIGGTEEHELFGLGPPDMKEGDYVCILIGCSVPVILRDEGGPMKLIGESYVHGKMEGEAMEDLREEKTFGPEGLILLK